MLVRLAISVKHMLLCTGHIDKGGSLNRFRYWIFVVVMLLVTAAYVYVTVIKP